MGPEIERYFGKNVALNVSVMGYTTIFKPTGNNLHQPWEYKGKVGLRFYFN